MKLWSMAAAAAFLLACGPKEVTVEVSNPASFVRVGETVEVAAEALAQALPAGDSTEGFVVFDQAGQEVPSQLCAGNQLIFQADVAPNATAKYTVRRGTPSAYAQKAYGRLVPERMDDWAWENDVVAHRIYGPALEATGEISNGIDVWLKRTADLLIDTWYSTGDYHTDHGQGLDCYKVGRTLGAGAMAPVVDTAFVLGNNFVEAECLANGPIRHAFRVRYAPYEVDGRVVNETRTVSLDAGSRFNLMQVEFMVEGAEEAATAGAAVASSASPTAGANMLAQAGKMPVAAGIVLRQGGKVASTDRWLAYSEPEAAPNGTTYVGLVMYEPSVADTIQGHAAMRTTAPTWGGRKVQYLFGSGWSKNGVASAEAWEALVAHEAEKIDNPLTVTIK